MHTSATLVITLALSTGALAAESTAYRGIIADHASGKITVIDAMKGRIIANFGVEGPARLKRNGSGRYVYATQGGQNRVDIIDTGITVTSHGDHADVEVRPPRMVPSSIEGAKPSHINLDNDRVAAFFDGEGVARIVRESALVGGKAKPEVLKTAAPHHGLAAPLGDFTAVSIPHPTDPKALPIGIDVLNRAGTSIARSTDCPRMHGEAKSGSTSAFGCADGVLLLDMSRSGGAFRKVAYSASIPTERMVRNMAGGQTVRSFFTDFGPDGMAILDPVSQDFTYIPLPSRRMHFARESLNGDFGYVVTEDGKLHKINALTGKIEASIAVTEAYSMEGGSSVARPRVSASGDRAMVTDPAKGAIHVIDTAAMSHIAKVAVPGSPFDVALIGAHGEAH